MKYKKNLIIWDFDGVLFDSLKECVLVTKLSDQFYREQKISLNQIKSLISSEYLDQLLFKMKRLRPFINSGQDYIWQYKFYEHLKDKYHSFFEYKETFEMFFNEKEDKLYQQLFYSTRKEIQNLLENEYFSLFIPYKQALEAFKESLKTNKNYICSSRDFRAIKEILDFYGVFFDSENIFTKDHNGFGNCDFTKPSQINQILIKENFLNEKFIFIEDQIKIPFVLKDKYPKMEIIYANYGYGLDSTCIDLNQLNLTIVDKPKDLLKISLKN